MDETAQRILGRKWAEEVLADNATASEPFRFGFRRRMLAEFKAQEIDRGAMTDEQSREFGAMVIPFGKYAGSRYDEVPLDYLEWLADQNSKLVRYVRSRRVQEEQGVMPEE
jgi:hypothetical protein